MNNLPDQPQVEMYDAFIEALTEIKADVIKAEHEGNKSAAKRVRKALLQLEKDSKEYRKRLLSIAKGEDPDQPDNVFSLA